MEFNVALAVSRHAGVSGSFFRLETPVESPEVPRI
jgi:hypothetical protein